MGLAVGVDDLFIWGPLIAVGGMIAQQSIENTDGDTTDRADDSTNDRCDNKCNATDTRSQAFDKAIDYAKPGPGWREIPWSQFNKPTTREDQIRYTEFRQNIGGDPYGYQSPLTGGEIVEHQPDAQHPCPHFHAKRNHADSGIKFPYKPGT